MDVARGDIGLKGTREDRERDAVGTPHPTEDSPISVLEMGYIVPGAKRVVGVSAKRDGGGRSLTMKTVKEME